MNKNTMIEITHNRRKYYVCEKKLPDVCGGIYVYSSKTKIIAINKNLSESDKKLTVQKVFNRINELGTKEAFWIKQIAWKKGYIC